MPNLKKPLKSSTKTLRAKCLKAIQLLSRISAADDLGIAQRVSCGKRQSYKEMDGGHFIPKGSSSFWALKIDNVHPQCKYCNAFGMRNGSAAQSYTLWMQDYYGRDYVEEMLRTKNNVCKIYKCDYEEMLKEFNSLIANHKERMGEL